MSRFVPAISVFLVGLAVGLLIGGKLGKWELQWQILHSQCVPWHDPSHC